MTLVTFNDDTKGYTVLDKNDNTDKIELRSRMIITRIKNQLLQRKLDQKLVEKAKS